VLQKVFAFFVLLSRLECLEIHPAKTNGARAEDVGDSMGASEQLALFLRSDANIYGGM